MFKNMKIKVSLFLGFGITILVSVAICDDERISLEQLTAEVEEWAKTEQEVCRTENYTAADVFLFAWEEKKDIDVLLQTACTRSGARSVCCGRCGGIGSALEWSGYGGFSADAGSGKRISAGREHSGEPGNIWASRRVCMAEWGGRQNGK